MQLPGTMLYPKRLSVKATDGCINVFGNSPTYVVMPAQAGIQTPLSSLCTSNAPVYVPGILRRFPQRGYLLSSSYYYRLWEWGFWPRARLTIWA